MANRAATFVVARHPLSAAWSDFSRIHNLSGSRRLAPSHRHRKGTRHRHNPPSPSRTPAAKNSLSHAFAAFAALDSSDTSSAPQKTKAATTKKTAATAATKALSEVKKDGVSPRQSSAPGSLLGKSWTSWMNGFQKSASASSPSCRASQSMCDSSHQLQLQHTSNNQIGRSLKSSWPTFAMQRAADWASSWNNACSTSNASKDATFFILRYEDLADLSSREYALRDLIEFAGLNFTAPSAACAFAWAEASTSDRHENGDEHTMPPAGASWEHYNLLDQFWARVEVRASAIGYTPQQPWRDGYRRVGNHRHQCSSSESATPRLLLTPRNISWLKDRPMARWRNAMSYRLGDLFFGLHVNSTLIQELYPGSVGARFLHLGAKPGDVTALRKVVDRYCMERQEARNTQLTSRPPAHVIHLRLGDSVCGGTYWMIKHRPPSVNCIIDTINDLTDPSNVDEEGGGVIVWGSHNNLCVNQSVAFVKRIVARTGWRVAEEGSADDHLCMMVNARSFIQGKGGFSRLAALLRAVHGQRSYCIHDESSSRQRRET